MKKANFVLFAILGLLNLSPLSAQALDITVFDAVISDYERPGLLEIEQAKEALKVCRQDHECRIQERTKIVRAYSDLLMARYSHLEKPIASEKFRYLQGIRELSNGAKAQCSTTFGVLPLRNNECYSAVLGNMAVVLEQSYFHELERN